MNRIKAALRKFIFCRKITRGLSSFILLLWFTKKYRWYKDNFKVRIKEDIPVQYKVVFNNSRFNLYLRTYSGDIEIFYEIFLKKVYNVSVVPSPQIIIDLGANIGLASLFFLKKYSQAKVIAVEPDPDNVEILKKNLANEISEHKVFIVEAAIAGEDADIFLTTPALKYNSTILESVDDNERKIKVKGIIINTLFKQLNIEKVDLIKIDIEGAEIKLFDDDLNWLEKVKEIIIEIHSETAHYICSAALLSKGFILKNNLAKIFYWVREKII